MKIIIKNSTVTIQQKEACPTFEKVPLSNSLRTKYVLWKADLKQLENNVDKIREIILAEWNAAVEKSKGCL